MSWFDEFKEGVALDYGVGRDDRAKMHYAERELQGFDDDSPRLVNMSATHPVSYRLRELLGIANKDAVRARSDMGIGALPTKAGMAGQLVGSIGSDLTQDISRNWWWLMNAAQATGNVINESTLGMVNPDLYGARKTDIDYVDGKALVNAGYAKEGPNGFERDPKVFQRKGKAAVRNYRSGYVEALAIPAGVAINNSLGLLTPFGGAEGYEAVMPSDEDPSKTSNVVAEVASKYILGRTGGLLDYDEFKQVRPDVSKGEYNAYKAFKYDNSTDLNPLDGDFTIPSGVLKGTTEGIHGPEIQFLGRSLPLTTAAVPFASAVAGAALGVRRGKKYRPGGKFENQVDPDAVKRGMIGGTAGAAGGIALGNLLEAERRRRNEAENGAGHDSTGMM
tara:strand:- start:608 stop:1780 length:1173 start_codon:yes stop_codon:yes gene_type:complete